MSTRSLGTLTLDLIAKVGGFTQGMDKAERSSAKWRKQVEKDAAKVGKAIGGAVAAGSLALVAMTTMTVRSAKEIESLAGVANTGAVEFQKYAAGARAMGIEQDKLADIFKDVNDKVGDFLNTGGGALADFFENIAPQVGVTADQFRNISGPQALGLYVASLEKANVSQADMTFYMEAIASDATALLPLLRNNSEGFRALGDAALAAGAIMDEKTLKAANELAAATWLIEQGAAGLKNQLMTALLPALADLADELLGVAEKGTAMVVVGEFLTDTVKWMARAAVGAVAAFELLGKTMAGSAAAVSDLEWSDMLGPVSMVKGLMGNMQEASGAAAVAADDIDATIAKYAKLFEAIDGVGTGQASGRVKEIAALWEQLRGTGGRQGSFVAPGKEQAADIDRVAKAVGAVEQAYQRQLALINEESGARKEASELAKLQFEIESGRLVGINAQQQERLQGLAAELDRLQALKVATEEAARAQAFADSLAASNALAREGFAGELAGLGMGEKGRQRLQQDLEIRRDFNRQMAELQQQFNAGDISEGLYQQETGLLKAALDERLAIQREYYAGLDAAEADWVAGTNEAWMNYLDSARDVAGNTQDMMSRAFQGAEDSLVDFVTTGKASFRDLATSILKDLARIAIQKSIANAAGSASGSGGGGWAQIIGSFFTQAKGGAWAGGAQMFAKGGAFTNSVVSSPTAFGMSGGRTGIMGEAGPEAIMPLTRGPDGSLGVKALGAGGGSVVQISAPVSVVVQDRSDEGMQLDQDSLASNLQTQMKAAAEKAVADSWKPGGTSWRQANGRG